MSKVETVTSKNESKSSQKSDKFTNCGKKCMMQNGDPVCYRDLENKEIVKTIPEETPSCTSSDADADSLHSGESLFKTFKFDAQEQNADMEKCMNFWKSLLAKNVKPMKCMLTKSETVKEKKPKQDVVKHNTSVDDEEVKNMWLGIYKDIQKRNLDKIKLVRNKICDPCADYIDEQYEKKQEQDEIKNLNDWKSKSQPIRATIDIRAQVQRTVNTLQSLRTSSKTSLTEENLIKVPSSKKNLPTKTPPVSQLTTPKSLDKKLYSTSESITKTPNKKLVSTSEIVTSEQPQTVKSPEKKSSKNKIKSITEILPPKTKLDQKSLTVEVDNQIQKSVTAIEKSTESMFCCNCGCKLEDCICNDVDECLKLTVSESQKSPCVPCDCSNECICGDHKICSCDCALEDCICENEDICVCGCNMEDCICENTICSCGCAMTECICETLNERNECSCGCQLEDCICEQLFSKSCNCGSRDCDCGEIQVLNAYLESLNQATGKGMYEEDIKMISTEIQTGDINEILALESTQKAGSYCVICGHFNCNCKSNKEV